MSAGVEKQPVCRAKIGGRVSCSVRWQLSVYIAFGYSFAIRPGENKNNKYLDGLMVNLAMISVFRCFRMKKKIYYKMCINTHRYNIYIYVLYLQRYVAFFFLLIRFPMALSRDRIQRFTRHGGGWESLETFHARIHKRRDKYYISIHRVERFLKKK